LTCMGSEVRVLYYPPIKAYSRAGFRFSGTRSAASLEIVMEVVFSQANHPHANGGWVLQRTGLGKDGIPCMLKR
jgi:hypothetical protein